MKIAGKIFLAIIFVLSFSCEDQGLIVKCPDCKTDEPSKAYIEVKLDYAYLGYQTVINVYEGNLEDSVLFSTFAVTGNHTSVNVSVNKKFTVTATYYIPDDYYVAIGSATPRVKFDKTKCDDPCYFVYDKDIDLRLKYTK
jgi:hypothetical protein